MKFKFILSFLILLSFFQIGKAGEVDILLEKLVNKGVITKEEAKEIKEDIKKEKEKEKGKYDFLKNTKFSGDLRIRYQNEDIKGDANRDRSRIRARWGFKTNVNENIEVGLRLATGVGEQTSTNQTFDNAFSEKNFWLDRAYVKYKFNDNFSFIGGKIENPFFSTDGIWDTDINPEGIAFIYKNQNGFFMNSGFFPVKEIKEDTRDPYIYGVQIGFDGKISEKKFKIAAGLYSTLNFEGRVETEISPNYRAKGNTLVNGNKGKCYKYEYRPFDILFEFTPFEVGKQPVKIYADYFKNIYSGVSKDTGYLFGFSIGKLKEKNDWTFEYNFRKIEGDATPAIFTDSDINGGGTDLKGHKISFGYQLNKYSSVGITYFIGEGIGSRTDKRNTLQLDYLVKF